jgi:hypothetical protein
MKKIIMLLIALIFADFTARAKNFNGKEKSDELKVSGKISFQGKKSDKTYKVLLIKNNKVIDSAEVKDGRSFTFLLERNEYYGIRIIKEGFIPKLVSVCTDMDDSEKNAHHFHFDTKLISESELGRLNKEMLDFPIAVISFNEKKDSFFYNKKYTADIKRKMYDKDLS